MQQQREEEKVEGCWRRDQDGELQQDGSTSVMGSVLAGATAESAAGVGSLPEGILAASARGSKLCPAAAFGPGDPVWGGRRIGHPPRAQGDARSSLQRRRRRWDLWRK